MADPEQTMAAAGAPEAAAGVLLELRGIGAGYGSMQVLWDIDLSVGEGEHVVILGANGAGKSTLLRVALGLLPLMRGTIRLRGEDVSGLRTDRRVAQGIGFMTEVGVFPELSVRENLLLGAYRLGRRQAQANLERTYEGFPLLAKFRSRSAGSLSGGQRKLVGVAKVLMGDPSLIVMDEPSSGLSPVAVQEVLDVLRRIERSDAALLIAEQNTAFLDLAQRAVVIEGGRNRFDGTVAQLRDDAALTRAYFGIE
ncbi:ABC transporter ATP-binding protein [Conexibacter sp. S30A1]|uniref:ABC transporter ATP-binding protein n=1 Tax=Conexibacter sp. S30A1 TaxID=2937800 RepID=UPI00200E34A0|nr:ABC transporter ATP-binding protein [Conexibacter sp. S30A1]